MWNLAWVSDVKYWDTWDLKDFQQMRAQSEFWLVYHTIPYCGLLLGSLLYNTNLTTSANIVSYQWDGMDRGFWRYHGGSSSRKGVRPWRVQCLSTRCWCRQWCIILSWSTKALPMVHPCADEQHLIISHQKSGKCKATIPLQWNYRNDTSKQVSANSDSLLQP